MEILWHPKIRLGKNEKKSYLSLRIDKKTKFEHEGILKTTGPQSAVSPCAYVRGFQLKEIKCFDEGCCRLCPYLLATGNTNSFIETDSKFPTRPCSFNASFFFNNPLFSREFSNGMELTLDDKSNLLEKEKIEILLKVLKKELLRLKDNSKILSAIKWLQSCREYKVSILIENSDEQYCEKTDKSLEPKQSEELQSANAQTLMSLVCRLFKQKGGQK